ncbi:TetR/AcrR family transcriptional regulator [Arthrobacter sp. AL08]|uniref:TetR/AcrR family transcriptional regulator n=1 Tax=Micrococcaceae TaxID=1268 RepID=UPI001CFFBF86|nr:MULTISPECIES: TetR/AcrR family transcriptional regulator [Micrococcaceae]MCB5280992.1 HTH-type transcriptional repressor KstR2 [Arthrobacter sp. ES1]MDI3242758.1 TetR/AcrR family transcriptional regulator [Arthrobacter sp. AL05]MDI3278769.1 TetR/AcrR family transcriptional regulator [Arthrobacter sp. AL08]MDJ0353089.1 TetR/AcrR family transcriptional regulator [Pseudarthrobacter sp. PH31-O2]WGZ79869.1 TetR/AcrR family transcriptional regulator [Arthrobacter sp. EM1]
MSEVESGDKKLRPGRTNATKQKLFEASMELIGERGAAGVTVDEIAAAAGVSKGTVYYNFGSKSDLIAQLLRYGVDILLTGLLSVRDESGDPLEQMDVMIGRAMDFMAEYPSFARLWVSENWRTPSEWQETFAELRGRLLEVVGAAIDAVAAVYPVDPAVSRGSLETAILGACFVVGLDRQAYNPERTREQSVGAIMTSMRGYVAK